MVAAPFFIAERLLLIQERLLLLMQERLTFGSLAEKGSFFLNAGNAPSSYAGRALSSNARKASSSLMQEKLPILSSRDLVT